MLTRHRFASAFLLLLLPIVAQALPPAASGPMRHYIVESDVPLDAAASAELAAEGIEVQQPMANHRYLVRIRDGATMPNDARIRSMRAYDAPQKIARAAYAEAAQGKAFARLRILFQKDVTFEDAQAAIDAVGGTIDTPFPVASAGRQRLTVRIPSWATQTLAADERVFGVYGPPLHVRKLNAVAAQLSNVTPLYSAPYNLTGAGVALSIFEPSGRPDTAHSEFGGRLISHFGSSSSVDSHATHTSGTMIAAGLNAAAKGMSPAATLHAFDANPSDANGDFDTLKFFSEKSDDVKAVGSVADNNSWDFAFSWQQSQDGNVWYGNEDGYGAYSGLESEPYDAIMRTVNEPLIVHAAGNDAEAGNPSLGQWGVHKHIDDQSPSGSFPHTYCYSKDGTGRDCPTSAPFNCSAGVTYCETTKHPTHGASTTIGLMASTKNSVTVGAMQPVAFAIAPFSSRGPTTDGRIKPELVAKGTDQFSTFPNNSYATEQGTSMATPVVTGIAGILTQQYRKTFGKTPSASILKTLLIAGADDLGNAGPDYTFGFGLADAKASADLIRDDNGTGSRIRTGTIANGQEIDFPITLAASQRLRVVLGWFDPEVLLTPASENDDPLADKTLVNDLDLRVVDPTGATVLPYVLDQNAAGAPATRGVNQTDTTEEVEIANAVPGTYHLIVKGAIGDTRSTSQDFVLIANGGVSVAACTDNYEPNDTQATAFGNIASAQTISAKVCSASDIDYYTFTTNTSPLSVTVAATDTPLKVTLSSNLTTTVVQTIAANSSATLSATFFPTLLPPGNTAIFVRVEANGTVGATGAYTLTPNYKFSSTPRKRSAKH
jgi:subtilisin family serine protease